MTFHHIVAVMDEHYLRANADVTKMPFSLRNSPVKGFERQLIQDLLLDLIHRLPH